MLVKVDDRKLEEKMLSILMEDVRKNGGNFNGLRDNVYHISLKQFNKIKKLGIKQYHPLTVQDNKN